MRPSFGDGRRFRRRVLRRVLFLLIALLFIRWWMAPRSEGPQEAAAERPAISQRENRLDRALTPRDTPAPRDGIAALVLMDVSGSMADRIKGDRRRGPKIEAARQAALTLIKQFDAYAKAHPEEPVLVGLYEFSERDDQPSAREIIPLSAADPAKAEAALATMKARGGTPIGDAMVVAKSVLDATGLTRRHLLVVTDGENTDGYKPGEVMGAISRRPPEERPSVYFVAFDIASDRFSSVRDGGGLVLEAQNAGELDATLNALLTGKILVEAQ